MNKKQIIILDLVICALLVIGVSFFYNKSGLFYYYQYEYEYGNITVRRYDGDYVILELLKNKKVVDRVKAKVDNENYYNLDLGLYFDTSGQVFITAESRLARYWRCPPLPYLYTYVLKSDKDCFFLGYLTDMSLTSAEQISEKLEYLQRLKDDGRFYALDYAYPNLDTLYKYDGANPVAVKMKVVDKKGNILYSNGK